MTASWVNSIPRLVAAVVAVGAVVPSFAATALWSEPGIDSYVYDNAQSPGDGSDVPTYTGGLDLNAGRTAFLPHGSVGPARLASFLAAFDTSDQVAAGLPPSRYLVHSVTFTATMFRPTPATAQLLYRTSPMTAAELLAETATGPVTKARPMELYGVGFRGGIEGFDFGTPSPAEDSLLQEWEHPYSAPDGGYVVYPQIGDPAHSGAYRDVSNNFTGGFSATDTGASTDPFDVVPWAVGQAPLAPGAVIPNNTTFSFALDLSALGVMPYVQQSLAAGQLGVMLSSLHFAENPMVGPSPGYPRWYTKDATWAQSFAPTLSISYDIAPALPGDYTGDGSVDGADAIAWQRQLGSSAVPVGSGADGDSSGTVGGPDLAVWRNHLPAAAVVATPVPEPTCLLLGAVGGTIASAGRRVRSRTRGGRPTSERGFTLVELLVAIAIIGSLVALLLPAVQSAREAARRMSCRNNLKQIGLAVQNYESAQQHLPPPNTTGDPTFSEGGSTLVALLPYLEQSAVAARIDPTRKIKDPANLPITGKPLAMYECPSMELRREVPTIGCDGELLGPGSYMISSRTTFDAWSELDGAFANPPGVGQPYQLGWKDVADGASHTLLVGEANYGLERFLWTKCAGMNGTPRWGDQTWAAGYWFYAWGHMATDEPDLFNNSRDYRGSQSARVFRSDHPGGVQFVMCDGSVQFLATGGDPEVRKALVTRAGEEASASLQ